jgi:UTP--glucose-1-phosphate uridylyltransferase
MSVRKSVVPAAGLGTRFWPATMTLPKEMLPLVDRPVMAYGLDELRGAGLTDVLCVTSRGKRALEDLFDLPPDLAAEAAARGVRDPAAGLQLHFRRQDRPRGLGHAVLLAEEHVGGEPFAVLLPDDVLAGPPNCLEEMIRLHRETGRPVVAVRRVPPSLVGSYGIVAVHPGAAGAALEVADLVEKPAPEDAPSDLAVVGRYVLPPEIFPLLRAQAPGAGGEVQLTDALRRLHRERPLLAYPFPGRVYDTGSKIGFLQATVELAAAHPEFGPAFRAYLAEVAAGWPEAQPRSGASPPARWMRAVGRS